MEISRKFMMLAAPTALAMALLTMCAHGHAQPVQPAGIPLSYFGLHIHRADAGTAWPNIPFGSWRLWDAYVGWAQLEPTQGQWDFSRLDKYVAMARITKTELLLPLAMTPRWAAARPSEPSSYQLGNASEPSNLEDWGKYVAAVAERYKGKIKYYEVWNEPSDKGHFTGTTEALVKLTCTAYRILKAIDPETMVVSPASAGGGRHIEYLDNFLAAGGKNCIDVVAHHFYVFRAGPEAMLPLIKSVRAVMAKNGVSDKPLWNTETGWWIANGDGTPDHQMVAKGGWKKLALEQESGDYLTRAFLLARSEGVERFYWYSWYNRYGLGMIEVTSGKQKPMVDSWRNIVERLVGATSLMCNQSGSDWRCTWVTKAGVSETIAWRSE